MKNIVLLFIISIFFSFIAKGQNSSAGKLEHTIGETIKRAYAASVRIWGFDTVTKKQVSGQFSGVVVGESGTILTAAHTTMPDKTYKVIFPDGRECIAVALGKIELAEDKTIPDVAMIKIVTKGIWPYALTGRSSALKEHDPCISIAYPESLGQALPTIRFGEIAQVKTEKGFIQSTCIMEPGDSGGPLFDRMGRLIALHSAIEISEKLNYEIPVDLYLKYWKALNAPQVYTSFPGSEEPITNDPLKQDAVPMPGNIDLNAAFTGISSKFKQCSLSLISNVQGKEQKVIGTLFSLRGQSLRRNANHSIIVSKSSLIGNTTVVFTAGKRKIRAIVIARDRENDLVLLKPAIEVNGGIDVKDLSTDSLLVRPGKFLVSLQPDTADVASISGSNLFGLPKVYSRGFFGALIAYKEGPLLLTWVHPDSPAGSNGLKAGDEVLKINGTPMNKAADYGEELQKYWPGDTLTIQLRRAGNNYVKTFVLGNMPEIKTDHPAEMFEGEKVPGGTDLKMYFLMMQYSNQLCAAALYSIYPDIFMG